MVGELVGIPEEDWPQIRAVGRAGNRAAQDPELAARRLRRDGEGLQRHGDLRYRVRRQRRQEEPREDLASLILAGNFGDGPMSDIEFGSFFVQLVTAGNDTTKTMLSSGTRGAARPPRSTGRAARRPLA